MLFRVSRDKQKIQKHSNNGLLAEGLGVSGPPTPMFTKNFKLSSQVKKFRHPGKSDFFSLYTIVCKEANTPI